LKKKEWMSGCDLGMMWDVGTVKPACADYKVKVTNFVNNATGCGDGSQDGTSFFLYPEGNPPSRCFKFYDTDYVDTYEEIDRWAMVWIETQISGIKKVSVCCIYACVCVFVRSFNNEFHRRIFSNPSKQIYVKTFTDSTCGSGTSDHLFSEQYTGDQGADKCLSDGDHHVYLKWC
jgi:hypothetical protein